MPRCAGRRTYWWGHAPAGWSRRGCTFGVSGCLKQPGYPERVTCCGTSGRCDLAQPRDSPAKRPLNMRLDSQRLTGGLEWP